MSHPMVQVVDISALRSHARQHDFFAPSNAEEIAEIAADLASRGQQEPIHVSPDGTIIRGHRRVMAAKLLNWESIRAVIRSDLVDANSFAAICDLINDNLMRRQLKELEIARCYEELRIAAKNDGHTSESGDVRDQIAIRLNMGKSGRSLDRIRRLLLLPRDIQDMISMRKLNKSHGEKILNLSAEKREALFAALRNSESTLDVLRKFGILKAAAKKSSSDLAKELLIFIQTNLSTISRNMKSLDHLQLPDTDVVTVLDRAAKFLATWANRKKRLKEESLNMMQSVISGK